MADSSSVHATSHILPIRPQQSLIIDLTPQVYDAFMFPIIECLKYSPLAPALTKAEAVPMEFLSQIFATAHYDKSVDRIFFDVLDHKASISKQRFCSIFGFEPDSSRVNLELIPVGHMFSMFYNMGYTEVLTTVTKFKKSCLPPQWNGLFTVLFKGLSECSAGSDGASLLFITLLYGVYNGINLDYGSVLWQQLIQSLASTSRHSEISYARFWTLVTKWVMDKYHVPIVAGSPMSSIGTFHTTKIIVPDASKFQFIGSIPESMYGDVPADSRIIKTYKEFRRSGPRELTPEMLKSIHEADKPGPRGKKNDKGKDKQVGKGAKGPSPKKRKTTHTVQSPPLKKRKTQPRRKLIIASSSSESEEDNSDSDESPRGNTPPRSPTPEVHFSTSPISSPPVTIPFSIPLITSTTQIPPTSIPVPPPIFTEATTTTAEVRTNVSDTGAPTTAPEPTPTTKPTSQPEPTTTTEPTPSPPPSSPTQAAEDEEPFLGGEDMTFDSVYYSPFQDNDNSAFKATLEERLTKLQEDLVAENSLMDALARKTTALKVKSLQLSNSQKEIESLRSEREIVSSCVSDVHAAISNILEAHDPIHNYSVRRDLAEKLAPALSLLSKIEGLLAFVSIPKQGGENENVFQPPPTSTATKTTEPPPTGQASGSGVKDKGKQIAEESDDDKETIADLLKKQGRDKDVDINARVAREAEEAERKQKEAHDLLESRKTLFPPWTLEKLLKEAIETPSILWLEPVISLNRDNSVDSQFDMPLTRMAFVFHAFDNIVEFPHPHPKVDRDLVEFYLRAAQPQYQTWSAQKIVNVRVLKPYREGNFTNVRFKVLRGSAKTEHAISLADLPNLNPHNWIILHNILLTNEAEYGPIIDHFKRMLVCYIMEVAKMDQEIASVFKKKPTISLVGSASDLNMMQMGKINLKRNSVMFTKNEGQKCLFALADKHLYTIACLEHVLGIIRRCKQNSADDKKYFDDMIQWYIRLTILALISRLFDTTKKVPAAGPSKKK
ncbi:hypothetical protein Lser_V15G12206 [Lactuca serriola]